MDRSELSLHLTDKFKPLLKFIKKLGACNEDAEDVAQETLLKAWKHSESISLEILDYWLYKVARNTFYSVVRKTKVTDATVGMLTEMEDGLSKIGRPDAFDTEYSVQMTLAQLKPLHLQALDLRFNQDLTGKRIAEILQVPENTAKSYILKAKAQFKKVWDNEHAS